MAKTAVKFCKKCSGIKPKDLKGVIDSGQWSEGCFGACKKKRPELKGMAYARVNGELIACPSKKKLVKKIAKAVA